MSGNGGAPLAPATGGIAAPTDLPASIDVVEVGPRDGLQLEPRFVETARKIAMVDAVTAAGVRLVEVTSFVHPKVMPQLRDAADVMRGIARRPGTVFSALVPNLRGAERAIEAGADALRVVVSVTDAANVKTLGKTVDESMADLDGIVRFARDARRAVGVILGMSFGCPLSGAVRRERVIALAGRAIDAGAGEVVVADSYGYADPLTVQRMLGELRRRWPEGRFGLHLHDTRGLAVANAYAALGAGVHSLDACLGGLGMGGLRGGEPAGGNLATEDFANLCEELGVQTGIDVEALGAVARDVRGWLGHALPGRVHTAGTRRALYVRIAAPKGPSASPS